MTEPEKAPERRIRDLVLEAHDREMGRIRLGLSGSRGGYAPPIKINQFRLSGPSTSTKKARAYCPICMAWEGSAHLGRHPYWRRVVAALARYAR